MRSTRAADEPANHRYPESEGLPELGKAISDWYERRFEITFEPMKETLPLIGSKEGIGHIALCFIDPGDIALVPDPGYPVYEIGTMFAGGDELQGALHARERLARRLRHHPGGHRARRRSSSG